tara:strand:- start:48777 stop:49310 length:534 start_codon:yes stop_codon:yes gene_type:complete
MKDSDEDFLSRDIKNLEEATSRVADDSLNSVVSSIPNRLDGNDGDVVFVDGDEMKQYKKINNEWYELGAIKRASNSLIWSQRKFLPNIRSQSRTSRSGSTNRRKYAKELSRKRKKMVNGDSADKGNGRRFFRRQQANRELSLDGIGSYGRNAPKWKSYGYSRKRSDVNNKRSRGDDD